MTQAPARALAPLTRKEAMVARELLALADGRPPGAELPWSFETLLATIATALEEYDRRPLWRRVLPPAGSPHAPRLRTIFEEFMSHHDREHRQGVT